jgi:hypothetical protein
LGGFTSLNALVRALIIIYLVELGKEFKSEILSDSYRLSIFDFVVKGLQIYKNPTPLNIDLDQMMHVKKFTLAINNVLGGDMQP